MTVRHPTGFRKIRNIHVHNLPSGALYLTKGELGLLLVFIFLPLRQA